MYNARYLANLKSSKLALKVEQEVSELDESLEYTARPLLEIKQTNKLNKQTKIKEFHGPMKSF